MVTIDRRPLFLETVDDLRSRVESGHEYQILGAAALLRKLLLDEAPLADIVNRDYKLKLRFKILRPRGPPPGVPPPELWVTADGLDPASEFPFSKLQQLTKSQFLAAPVVWAKGHKLSVGDVINYFAHIGGAVHTQEPKYAKDKALVEVLHWISTLAKAQGPDLVDRQLCVIGRVVVDGLTELEVTVREQFGAGTNEG